MPPPQADLNKFVAFSAVADAGGYSRAAEKLGLSTAFVSRQVSALEKQLGLKLFNRTTRKLALTPAGMVFSKRCQQLLKEADAAVQELEEFRSGSSGSIRISSAITFGRLHLIPAIMRFLAEHPHVSVEVRLSENWVDLIDEPSDVVIRPAEEEALLSYVAKEIAPVRWILCASPRYLERHGAPQTVDDLAGHNCIVYNSNVKSEWQLTDGKISKTIKVAGNFRANSADAVVDALLADAGIAAVPTLAVYNHLAEGRLARVLPDVEAPVKMLYAAYLPNLLAAPTIRSLVAYLQKEFGKHPYWDQALP